MNPLMTAAAGALARWLITFAAAQGIALSENDSTQIASGAIAAAMLVWSLWHKFQVDSAITAPPQKPRGSRPAH